MIRNRELTTVLATIAIAVLNIAYGQVQNLPTGQYRLNPLVPPSTFSIGPNSTSGYALDVHGEQMTPPLGNVFKTDAPSGLNTYWRMFHRTVEYGNFFHIDNTTAFNLNATVGNLRLLTNSIVRAQLNRSQVMNLNGFTGINTLHYYVPKAGKVSLK